MGADVGLGLDNLAGKILSSEPAHQDFTEKALCHFEGWSSKKRARKFHSMQKKRRRLLMTVASR